MALTVLCPQTDDVEQCREEGKANSPPRSTSELSAAQPWQRPPANTLAIPCPGVPSSASSALRSALSLQSPVGSVSAQGPPVSLWVALLPHP